MRYSTCLVLELCTVTVLGCSGSTSPSGTDGGGGLDAARADGATPGDAGARDAAASDAPEGPSACVMAGGTCGCAGGCAPGFHPAPAPLLDACPQPCDGCGACGQQCCLPDDAGVPSTCSGATCALPERCVHPCCGGAGPSCEPLLDGGTCGLAEPPCTLPGGGSGCQRTCTPDPPYCSSTLPPGCTVDGSGEVICLCA